MEAMDGERGVPMLMLSLATMVDMGMEDMEAMEAMDGERGVPMLMLSLATMVDMGMEAMEAMEAMDGEREVRMLTLSPATTEDMEAMVMVDTLDRTHHNPLQIQDSSFYSIAQ